MPLCCQLAAEETITNNTTITEPEITQLAAAEAEGGDEPEPGGVSPPREGEVDWVEFVLPVLEFRTVLMMVAGEQVVDGGGGAGLDVTVTETGLANTLATAAAGAGTAVMTTSPPVLTTEDDDDDEVEAGGWDETLAGDAHWVYLDPGAPPPPTPAVSGVLLLSCFPDFTSTSRLLRPLLELEPLITSEKLPDSPVRLHQSVR